MKRLLITLISALSINIAHAGIMGEIEESLCWTGFYLGGNAGYGWNHRKVQLVIPSDFNSQLFFLPGLEANAYEANLGYHQNGFIGGAQAGYNYQYQRYVLGLETDFDGSLIKDTHRTQRANLDNNFGPWFGEAGANLKWLGTVRGRLGFVPFEPILLYGTGGFAYGEVSHLYRTSFPASNQAFTLTSTRIKPGWTAGGGAEFIFAHHWSAKAEYLYYHLGRRTEATSPSGDDIALVNSGEINTLSTIFKDVGHVIRVGINYRFC